VADGRAKMRRRARERASSYSLPYKCLFSFIGHTRGKFSLNFIFLKKIQGQRVLSRKYAPSRFDHHCGLRYLVSRLNQGVANVAKKPENLSFEESLGALERIVAELEQGDIALDDALKQFELGIKLVRNSQAKLDQAQQRVAILLSQDDSAPLAPFTIEGE
jgi:exodeoxyribonuclease VII small subunit